MSEDEEIVQITNDQAHVITGIDHRHLKMMRDGIMLPSEDHAERIVQSLGKEYLELFNSHRIPKPETIQSQRGKIPDGFHLIRRTTIGELKVGDLIPYTPENFSGKPLWVEVRSIEVESAEEDEETNILLIDLGGIQQYLNKSLPVRVARAISE